MYLQLATEATNVTMTVHTMHTFVTGNRYNPVGVSIDIVVVYVYSFSYELSCNALFRAHPSAYVRKVQVLTGVGHVEKKKGFTLMQFEHAVSYLINLLRTGRIQNHDGLLNNLVYYIPRLQSIEALQHLVTSTFDSNVWVYKDLFELYEATQAIFQWKLEISEPTVSLEDFYSVWDFSIAQCQSWTPQKLAILGGILSTKERFKALQRNNFLDDSGKVIKLYNRWRNEYFMPIWCSLICKPRPLARLNEMVAIYATISEASDLRWTQLPWNTVTSALTDLSTSYIRYPPAKDSPITRNLNRFVKTLQISVARSDSQVVSTVLRSLCRECFNLCTREVNSAQPNKSYSVEYYRNVLFAIIIELASILSATQKIPEYWYPQVIMCLFFINFISQDVGIQGFDSYEYVYDFITTGVTMLNDTSLYMHVLDTMLGNVWKELPHPNKPNDAKIVFILNYLEKTVPNIINLSPQFIETIIIPLQQAYIDSSNSEIRESMHLLLLSLFENCVSSNDLTLWQARHYHEYIDLATIHFLRGSLSEKQLLIVYQKMSSRLKILQSIDEDLSKSTLHYTYLKIINCTKTEQQRVLLLCLIYQLPFASPKFVIHWFDTCQELISTIAFDKNQKSTILVAFWEVISSMKSDAALKWWYTNVVSCKSLL